MKFNFLSNKINNAQFWKIIKSLSDLLENGMQLKDIRDEIKTDLKFQRDKLINKLQLVSKEEFNVLKKVVEKQDLKIRQLTKKEI